MRTKTLHIVVRSDIDLCALSTRRVTISLVEQGVYLITSSLKFWSCERHSFVWRYLNRKKPGLAYFTGNCSAPTGYFWEPSNHANPDALDSSFLDEMRALKQANYHLETLEKASHEMGFFDLALKFQALLTKHRLKGHLDWGLSKYRFTLYTELMAKAKLRLSQAQFDLFYMCF